VPRRHQPAQELIRKVFKVVPRQMARPRRNSPERPWLNDAYAAFDAEKKSTWWIIHVTNLRMSQRLVLQGQSNRTNARPSARAAPGTSARRDDGIERRRVPQRITDSPTTIDPVMKKHSTTNIHIGSQFPDRQI